MIKKVLDIDQDFYPTHSSAEAKICLKCPFPECNDGYGGKKCERLSRLLKKLRGKKNEKLHKKVN